MKIGFGAPVAGAWAGPQELVHIAGLAEELGYQEVWTFQRLLTASDGSAAPVYQSVLDPLVALSYTAARTSRLRLGVALINAPFVSPVYLAKQAATLDLVSGGRLDLGLGIGWSPLELEAFEVSTARRGVRIAEYIKVLRACWSAGPTRFEGEFYRVPNSSMEPKPAQPGGPPILFGGTAPTALARAGRLADGWLSSSGTDPAELGEQIQAVRDAAERAGRDPDVLRIIVRGVVRYDAGGKGVTGAYGKRRRLSGSAEQIREDAQWLSGQGVTELFYDLNWDPLVGNPSVEPASAVDRAEEIIRALAP